MITVILLMVPLTIPRMFGIRIYGVLTGSMTPAYSVGGVVYVKETDISDIHVGDVVTYRLGTDTEYVMTHRVVEMDDSFFITKGDANNAVDPEPVSYDRIIGKVVLFIPGLAGVAEFVNSTAGRSVFIILFASAFILWVVADIITPSNKNKSRNDSVKKKNNSRWLQSAGVVLIVGAFIYLGSILINYRQSTTEYDALESEVFAENDTIGNTNGDLYNDNGAGTTELTADEKKVLEEIVKLHEENPDVIGWIKFDNPEISYPIMQGEDNDYYLNHTFSGEKNSAGSIFMETANSSDFSDCHTILYGHNMKNRSMFGSLKSYKTEDFYPGNEYFTIYTLDKVYRYEIFAYYDISMYGEIYNISFAPGDEFQHIIDNMCRRSYYDTGVKPKSTDKILTLSTCSTKGNRFVVNAVRISEK